MTELEGLIHYWKTLLTASRLVLSPETIYFAEQTIKALEELKKLKES